MIFDTILYALMVVDATADIRRFPHHTVISEQCFAARKAFHSFDVDDWILCWPHKAKEIIAHKDALLRAYVAWDNIGGASIDIDFQAYDMLFKRIEAVKWAIGEDNYRKGILPPIPMLIFEH